MHERAKEILRVGNKLFSDKGDIDSLNQEIALNFYSRRADFTSTRNQGDEYADHLFSSYPERARQELANMLGEFLRAGKWFSIHVDDEEIDQMDAERSFMERLTEIQWRAMNDPVANLTKAAVQTDHDFATFGNGVLQYQMNREAVALLFRNHHLKNCAWSENSSGQVDNMHREWEPSARVLKKLFPRTISKDVKLACEKDPEKTFKCRHVVIPAEMYDYESKAAQDKKFVSLYIEQESQTVLEEVGQNWLGYVVPRWMTVSNSAYAVSMATSILLPDSRTLQTVMRTLREAGEKYVDPPMIAVADAIRSDFALYAGGVTTADIQYDERLGDVLRPISQNPGSMPVGFEIAENLKEDIRSGFFLDKIQLPETNKDMTATEVRRRIQEHIRSSAPLSKPIIEEYNSPLCDGIFDMIAAEGGFPIDEAPESLRGRDLQFKFRSPVDELEEQNEADVFEDVMTRFLLPAMTIDEAQVEQIDLTTSLRDAMRAAGWKQEWFQPIEAVMERKKQVEQNRQVMEGLSQVEQIAGTAQAAGGGIEAVAQVSQNNEAA